MSVSSGPPELPPDSPGSSVSSRLQNEYTELLRRAVVLNDNGRTTTLSLNPSVLGPGKRTTKKEMSNDLIDLNSPESTTPRTDRSQSATEIQRESLSRIPTLKQILSTGSFPTQREDEEILSRNVNDPMVQHLVRYSELLSDDLESKPITEKMDHWYLDLKKNLMNEFEKLRFEFLEEAQKEALREKQAQAKEYIRLNQDIKTMREMLTHYEQTLDEKDRTEKNLNKALDHLYNKTLMYRHYYELRLVHIEQRRQQYSFSLAKRFHDEKIKRKALNQWKSMAEREWRKRFEKACEKKAKDVLLELGNEYEIKYKEMELKLLDANEEIGRLRADKNDQDEALKKAFMRGVCALNMEAMSVLLKDQQEAASSPDQQGQTTETSDDENRNEQKSFVPRHTLPTCVYKESLPTTIFRSGEARPFRNSHLTHHTRRVTFERRPKSAVHRTRPFENNILVERHGPTNRIPS